MIMMRTTSLTLKLNFMYQIHLQFNCKLHNYSYPHLSYNSSCRTNKRITAIIIINCNELNLNELKYLHIKCLQFSVQLALKVYLNFSELANY